MSASQVTPSALNSDLLGTLIGQAAIVAPTFAAAVALDLNAGLVQQLNGVNATSATCTVTAAMPEAKPRLLVVICKAAGGTVTYTFGTGFKATGDAAPTVGTTIAVAFIGDGTNFVEFARSASAITY